MMMVDNTLAVKGTPTLVAKEVPSITDYEKMSAEELLLRLEGVSSAEKHTKYHLACLLYSIKLNKAWVSAPPFDCPNFSEWVYQRHGYDSRTTRYFISIVLTLKSLNLNKDEINELLKIGWKKIYHITRVVKNRQELQKWIEYAENQSCRELESSVRLEFATKSSEEVSEVKGRVQEESRIEALDVKIRFKTSENFSIFKTVYGYIEKKFGTKSPEDVIGFMAAQYMASTTPDTSIKFDLNNHIKALEKLHDVKIKVVRCSDKS